MLEEGYNFLYDVIFSNNTNSCVLEIDANYSFEIGIYGDLSKEEAVRGEEEVSDIPNASINNIFLTECSVDGDPEYSLEDAVRAHEENVEIRLNIKESLDTAANVVSAGYYAFVLYTCPVAGLTLGAFKIFKSYGAFDDYCNEEKRFIGYTMCDVAEEALFSQTLLSVGGKLSEKLLKISGASQAVNVASSQALNGASQVLNDDSSKALKFAFVAIEKFIRKTALSNSKVKSKELDPADSVDYAANIAFVAASEAVECATETAVPKPVQLALYKIAGQLSKQFTKDWINGNYSFVYTDSVRKGIIVTACNLALPGFKEQTGPAHLYGHCLKFLGSSSMKLEDYLRNT